ncbi:MAG TPA: bifunctional adenosylcobinamide kinase/adenosylcobinamide-phosphate guanylyltransferase [Acidimicrobiales bacterium]
MILLVLGGARSGKSTVAEGRAASLAAGAGVTYLATAAAGGDADLGRRIDEHRARRPMDWTTVEVGTGLPGALRETVGVALVDGLGPWLAGSPSMVVDVDDLCSALGERADDTVLVSDEVGLGVHPSTDSGRQFRDALGLVNQAVAASADEVLLVIAGRALPLDRLR